MGIILAGRHVDLDQRVAIKALRRESLDDAELVARFLREARASAKLKSEHVARVIDVGRHGADQVPFIVMEFLHGSDLSEVHLRHQGIRALEGDTQWRRRRPLLRLHHLQRVRLWQRLCLRIRLGLPGLYPHLRLGAPGGMQVKQ